MKLTKSQKKNMKKWIRRLRNPSVKQTQDQLRDGDSPRMCCLGQLCEVFRKETGKGKWDENGLFILNKNKDGYCPPDSVNKYVGINGQDCDSLAFMNDHGRSFREIADYIEENLLNG